MFSFVGAQISFTPPAQLHAAGAISVPLFVPCQGASNYDKLRQWAYRLLPALQGAEPTDWNPNFEQGVMDVAGDKAVMIMCDRGGSIGTYPMPFGVESRSWVAIHQLLVAGMDGDRILHVRGGMLNWEDKGFDCEYYE